MTELYYGKGRLFWLLLGGVALTAGAGWLAVSHPAPNHESRYAGLYALLGPTGIELLFGASCLFFAAACVMIAGMLVGLGVAAAITPAGMLVGNGGATCTCPGVSCVGSRTRGCVRKGGSTAGW